MVSQDVLLRELEAERRTGMPGPPPVLPEPDRVKRARLLRLDRELHRRYRRGEAGS